MSKFSLNPINVPAEEFLHAFFDVNEKVCLRVFSDKSDSAFSGQKMDVDLDGFTYIIESLRQHNQAGRGIYFVINYGGHEDADIKRINAQFMECDNIPLEEQLAKIEAFPLEPSLIVKTRKSLHCYWLVKNASIEQFRHIQRGLVARFSADPACVNESRVFRLPGFYHCKEEPILVECVKFNPELRYTQEELAAHLPEVPDESATMTAASPIRDVGSQKGLALLGRKCLFMQYCKSKATTLPEPLWYAMITNLAVFEGGAKAIHDMSKSYPKYSFAQTEAKIAHFIKSGTKPMTCEKIAQLGFVCPKLKSCHANAPSGLAFRELDVKDLLKYIGKCKAAVTLVENVTIARKFVNDYLFNVEPHVAEAFINSEIKAKFNFKASDLKGLVSQQKELFQAYSVTQKTRTAEQKDNYQSWYEYTKSGALHFMPGVLSDHLAERFHAFYTAEQYYYYENGVYTIRADKDAKATVQTYLNPRDATTNQIHDAEYQWQLKIRKPILEINPNPYIINCTNGLYNVLDDSFRPHDPKYYSTVQIKAKYAPEAECNRMMEFLHSVLDEPEIALLQEIFGYFLVPITRAQKSFILCGLPNVGKSKILQVLQEFLLGAENVSNIPLQNLSERFQPAELFGKMANIYADLPDKKIDDAGMFKAVTGEDYITGERKHKDPFSFKPYARFLYSCNDIPRNYGDRSEAFYRRLIIIRFSIPVPLEIKDLQLPDKLKLEADGILAWSIIGLKRLIANNYQFAETDATMAEVKQYKTENSSVLAFVDECCNISADATSFRKEMFDTYIAYCSDSNRGAVAQPRFNNEITALPGVVRADEPVTRRRIFRGIALKD